MDISVSAPSDAVPKDIISVSKVSGLISLYQWLYDYVVFSRRGALVI